MNSAAMHARLAPLLLLILYVLGSAPATLSEPGSCSWSDPSLNEQDKPQMKAVVLGGTGAIGAEVVKQLLSSNQWSSVTTIGRREVALPPETAGLGKLHQVALNMDHLKAEGAQAFQGADAVFCALGTTRGDAGSAEQFKKVDHEYVAASAELAKAAGARYFGLVSAVGANPNIWSSDLKPFHPLLYTKTKGLAEEAVKSQGFDKASIYRPGLLDRGDKARGLEKMILGLTTSIKVADVAKFMISDAAARLADSSSSGVRVYEMKELLAGAGAAQSPATPS